MIKDLFNWSSSNDSHDGFLVKQHKPIVKWLMAVLAAIILIITFFLGRWDQDRTIRQSYDMMQELNESIDQLTQRNDKLVRKNVQLSAGSKIDRDAYNSVNDSLVDLQSEILLLKEELVFYRGIVSPSKSDFGVNLQEISLSPGAKDDEYGYKVVLTKSGRSKYSVKGELVITLIGLIDGKTKSLNVNEISKVKKKSENYSFRYFQIFEGDLTLPEGFYPESIKVNIKSKTKKVKSIENTFNWAEIVSGET